jgi:LAGLIDADG endonuclease
MNKGLSPELAIAFPQIKLNTIIKTCAPVEHYSGTVPYGHASLATNHILSSYWISGFASGEGSFQVDIKKNKTLKPWSQVLLRFSIGQQARDEQLLRSFIDYWDCGFVQKKFNKKYNKEYFEFRVEKFTDIETKIIPFFVKYPIVGQKQLDFQDFCRVAKLMKEKAHITTDGFNEIRKIKEGMNTGRIY